MHQRVKCSPVGRINVCQSFVGGRPDSPVGQGLVKACFFKDRGEQTDFRDGLHLTKDGLVVFNLVIINGDKRDAINLSRCPFEDNLTRLVEVYRIVAGHGSVDGYKTANQTE